jgi:hypothetical protein
MKSYWFTFRSTEWNTFKTTWNDENMSLILVDSEIQSFLHAKSLKIDIYIAIPQYEGRADEFHWTLLWVELDPHQTFFRVIEEAVEKIISGFSFYK